MTKAVSLLSGGLDSILATRLTLNQGIEVVAVNFQTPFSDTAAQARKVADKFGISLKIFNTGEEYFKIVKNPKYGYGRNINPCVDCHIYMFKKAGEYMKESGASFLITGEVLGERPMSQRRDVLEIIDRDSGLKGLILRPLSAKLLEPTAAEKQGLIDRDKLLAIKGRSRKPQLKLAEDLGISEYLTPAGGCLLTDPGFSNRMRDLIRYKPNFTINDINLLRLGRHFRLAPKAKLIVGRNEKENNKLLDLVEDGDVLFNATKAKGPIAIARGEFGTDSLHMVSSIVARYSDGNKNRHLEIAYKKIPNGASTPIMVMPAKEEKLNSVRI